MQPKLAFLQYIMLYSPPMPYTAPDLTRCTILLIEDDRLNRLLLREIFIQHGFLNILEAADGQEGIEKTEGYNPDLVVLDIMMPKVSGLEYCMHIREQEKFRHLPILVQTALADSSHKAMIFAKGATDYISKPLDPSELIARAKVHLEHQHNIKQLQAYQTRLAKEFAAAQTMQQFLLPNDTELELVRTRYAINLEHHFQTCSELGGDFWGITPLSPSTFSIYCVDFAGHGLDAALNTFRLHTLMHEHLNTTGNAGDYLALLNKKLCALLPLEQFATMFYGIIDTSRNTLGYSSAGSPPPFIFYKNLAMPLESSGLPLGIVESAEYPTFEIPFNIGDTLLLYSDSLIESPDKQGNVWQEKAIIEQLENTLHIKNNKETFQDLLAYFGEHYGANLNDDLTLALLQRR
jgi:sigma-B regulation protein RsbU (phosphoserine phosphatase)